MEVYNFGSSAKYLFRPCQNEDGTADEECNIKYDSGLTGSMAETTEDEQETLSYIKSVVGK